MDLVSDARLGARPLAERVTIMRQEIDRLAARLSALTPEQLDRPAIGDWTVREVVAHMAVVPEFYTDGIVRGASGDTGGAGNPTPAGTGRGEIAADNIRKGAVGLARKVDDVIGRFRRSAEGLADALSGDEAALSYPCYHPGGLLPANRFLVLFLKELGLHEWDIFEALEPPCAMGRWGADAAFQALEEEIASGSLRWVTDPARNPQAVTIRVTTTGAVAGDHDLILDPDWTRLVGADDGRAIDGRLRIDAGDFTLGCSGRLDLVAAVESGRAEGDLNVVRVLAGRLTGM
ncbi:MAG: maleylpyruvate isomerase N-terminal domain-containing protein [Acidimicrobiia bacterium]|nr:maleylpyruvate isomerase N-terminal domain-containing protein [Acidimicrobiia bacterium]MDH4362823.1 maleylpyruvate isomerase N-terminal domain-containing protein [Acidimicrobiia bacterium]MDH5291476.1 maleylpyruvate isomerase N-terminal domain-containing protein [Acidimicrobiia bacterium]